MTRPPRDRKKPSAKRSAYKLKAEIGADGQLRLCATIRLDTPKPVPR